MTILNAYIDRDRVLMVSNTQGVGLDGSAANTSKLFALPHANCVLGGRGQIAMLATIFSDCVMAMTDLDKLLPKIAESMANRFQEFKGRALSDGVAVDLSLQLLIAGWSPRSKRMALHFCDITSSGENITLREIWPSEQGVLSPGEAHWNMGDDVPSTPQGMAQLAKYQAACAMRDHPGHAWLGDLTLAEITPESITFTSVKDFWAD